MVESEQRIPDQSGTDRPASLWGIGGGKGGVGKSVTALNLATHLALEGRRVVLVDGDLGAPNLHTLLGIRSPRASLSSFIRHEVERLEDALSETSVPGLRLLAGSRDAFGAANPKHTQKLRLVRHLRSLEADEVVLDLGAGTSFHTLDLFNAATYRLAVLTAEPTALQNAYGFIKMALYRHIVAEVARAKDQEAGVREAITEAFEGDPVSRVKSVGELRDQLAGLSVPAAVRLDHVLETFQVHLVVSMATEEEGRTMARTLAQVSREFLQLRCPYAGHVGADSALVRSVRRMRPHLLDNRFGFRWQEIARIRNAVDEPQVQLAAESPEPLARAVG